MTRLASVHVEHGYLQHNPAPPERVFPLLCPVREAEWVPGWQYRMIYSKSGMAEMGCVFATPNEAGSETTWMITEYDPAGHRIGFAWVWPGMVAAQIQIALSGNAPGATEARIRYAYTGLSVEGNDLVARWDSAWFRDKMEGWEQAINHFLACGEKIAGAAGK